MKKISLSDHVNAVYTQLEGNKIAGMFDLLRPSYVVRDPELIKHITVKDFDHFVDIPVILPDNEPILTKGLQSLKGNILCYLSAVCYHFFNFILAFVSS
jgi:cytochrome P450 family 9